MRLPFADGYFDLVTSNKVTHHIPPWPVAFAEMVRVLRPGGWLLYDDFVLPAWAPRRFPNRRALGTLVEQSGLAPARVVQGLLHLEALWRKPVETGGGGVPVLATASAADEYGRCLR